MMKEPDLGKATILVVDDVPANIRILSEILGEEYEFIVASTGTIALKAVANNHLDLILLDIVMPEMDGYEVCRQLKADSLTEKIPEIFISAKDSRQDEYKGLELGAVDYISKPFRRHRQDAGEEPHGTEAVSGCTAPPLRHGRSYRTSKPTKI